MQPDSYNVWHSWALVDWHWLRKDPARRSEDAGGIQMHSKRMRARTLDTSRAPVIIVSLIAFRRVALGNNAHWNKASADSLVAKAEESALYGAYEIEPKQPPKWEFVMWHNGTGDCPSIWPSSGSVEKWTKTWQNCSQTNKVSNKLFFFFLI